MSPGVDRGGAERERAVPGSRRRPSRSRPRRCGSRTARPPERTVGPSARRLPGRRRPPRSPGRRCRCHRPWRPPSSGPGPTRCPAPGSAISTLSSEPRAGARARRRWPRRPHPCRRTGRSRVRSGPSSFAIRRVAPAGTSTSRPACRCRRRRRCWCCPPRWRARSGRRAPGRSASIWRSVMSMASRPSATCEPASRRVVMSIEVGQHAGRGQDAPRGGAPRGVANRRAGSARRVPNSHVVGVGAGSTSR